MGISISDELELVIGSDQNSFGFYVAVIDSRALDNFVLGEKEILKNFELLEFERRNLILQDVLVEHS